MPFRLQTTFLFWACCRPLEWLRSMCSLRY